VPEPVTVLVHGADRVQDVPGLDAVAGLARFRFARTLDELRDALDGASVLLGWDFRAGDLQRAWDRAGALEWIHWAGAGVDALLFDELVASRVQVTNARGVFDQPMAEYALALVLAMAKGLPQTLQAQRERRWSYRTSERLAGRRALVVGAGSIGRAIARMLRAAGLEVSGVGRRARGGDPDFGTVHAVDALDALLPEADFVVLITPLTEHTRDLFGAERFARMHPGARFINLGRGALIDEAALAAALRAGTIAGAALDVFRDEPLPEHSELWEVPNLIVSPHMSGDTHGYKLVVAEQFIDNLRRFATGEPLLNPVDKTLGFAAPAR